MLTAPIDIIAVGDTPSVVSASSLVPFPWKPGLWHFTSRHVFAEASSAGWYSRAALNPRPTFVSFLMNLPCGILICSDAAIRLQLMLNTRLGNNGLRILLYGPK